MRDNQTTRRMPMIVTAMACATASMLAGLALAPSAMAAGATITLNGADGNSLAGHDHAPVHRRQRSDSDHLVVGRPRVPDHRGRSLLPDDPTAHGSR